MNMFILFQQIWRVVDRLLQRLFVAPVENLTEAKVLAHGFRAMSVRWNSCNGSEQRLANGGELPAPLPAALEAAPRPELFSGSYERATSVGPIADIAASLLAENSAASIRNVLVLDRKGAPPFRRMEIHLDDPKDIAAMLNLLAAALQSGGFEFHEIETPCVPVTDIWITSGVSDRRTVFISCASGPSSIRGGA